MTQEEPTISFKTPLNKSGELEKKNVEHDNMVQTFMALETFSILGFIRDLCRILFEILLSTKILM
jgi:hypothetical protein